MLIDMIHDNHGEPPFRTRFRDPAMMRARGYEAIVIPDALAAIPSAYDHSTPPASASSASMPNVRHPAEMETAVDTQLRAALAQGLRVFFYADALLLPRLVVNKRPQSFLCDDHSGRLCPGKPAVYEAIADQIHELFDRWPDASGLILRTGEVYPEATPHMVGSPLHAGNCPTCKSIALKDRMVSFITRVFEAVVIEAHKTYIHRAWQPAIPGLPNMHDDPEVYREISARVPASPHLLFSFKFTRGDFRVPVTGQSAGGILNPCVLADNRPKWIEFQCEREHEGKGAFPNYQHPQWQAAVSQLLAAGFSADDMRRQFGIWGWSRGGGWGGPYVQREEWIDANVHALASLYKNPAAASFETATHWVAEAFVIAESDPPAPAIGELLELSARTIRKLLYVSVLPATGSSWLKDDLLDIEAIWSSALQAADSTRVDEAVAEKLEAMQGVDRIRHLFDIASPGLPNKSQVRDLSNTLACFNSFAGAVAHIFIGFVRYIQWTRSSRTASQLATDAADHLENAQAHWQHHTQRHALLPGAPSMFQENTLWDRTNDCLEALQSSSV